MLSDTLFWYTGQTGSHNWSDRPAWIPPKVHQSDRSADQSKQNREVAPSAHKGATRQIPKLRVSIHHFPPLCIMADKFDAAGAEIHVCVP